MFLFLLKRMDWLVMSLFLCTVHIDTQIFLSSKNCWLTLKLKRMCKIHGEIQANNTLRYYIYIRFFKVIFHANLLKHLDFYTWNSGRILLKKNGRCMEFVRDFASRVLRFAEIRLQYLLKKTFYIRFFLNLKWSLCFWKSESIESIRWKSIEILWKD